MNKKSFASIILAIISICCWTACDKDSKTGSDIKEPETNTLEFISRLDSVNIATSQVYNILCVSDTLFYRGLDSGNVQFNPDYGIMINEATPSIQYAIANSFEQARHTFINDFLSPIMFLNSDTTGTEIKLDLGSHGSITFSSENGDGKVAKIDIDLKQLDKLTFIYFIHQEAWPQNDAQNIAQGNTFISEAGLNYVCIKECQNGWGYLATFDLGYDYLLGNTADLKWIQDPTLKTALNPVYYWAPTWNAFMHTNMPSSEELLALQGFIYDQYGNKKIDSEIALKRIVCDNLINKLYYPNGQVFACGENCWWLETTNQYKYVYYYGSQPGGTSGRTLETTKKATYIWGSNRFFVMLPIRENCRFEDWRFDSFNVSRSYIKYYDYTLKNEIDYQDIVIEPSYNYRNGVEPYSFIRMRCIKFGNGYDYEAHGLIKTDRFDRKTSYDRSDDDD